MKPIYQGEIYLADLNPVRGHEQAGYRPVLVLQCDILNQNLNTVIIAPITKNLKARGFLTTWFLDRKISNLRYHSVILLYQIRTFDKLRLKKLVAQLNHKMISEIKQQMFLLF